MWHYIINPLLKAASLFQLVAAVNTLVHKCLHTCVGISIRGRALEMGFGANVYVFQFAGPRDVFPWLGAVHLACSGLCQEINLWWRKEKRLSWGRIWLEIDVTDGFSLMCRSVLSWLLSQRWFAPRVGRKPRLSTLPHWWVNSTFRWALGVAGSSGCREKTGTSACRGGERQPWKGVRASVILKWLGKTGGISYMILVKQNPVLSFIYFFP